MDWKGKEVKMGGVGIVGTSSNVGIRRMRGRIKK